MSVDAPEREEETAGSLLEQLRARREKIAQSADRELTLEVPGYDGALAVRYRYPFADGDEVIAAAQRIATSLVTPEVQSSQKDKMTVVLKCCHELVARESTDGEWESLDPDSEAPLRFTARLAELLNIALPSGGKGLASFVARNVFSPAAQRTGVYDGDPALAAHAVNVAGWLQGTDRDVDGVLRGE